MTLRKNQILWVTIWGLAFAASILLLLVIPQTLTGSIFVTMIFCVIAFVFTFILWLYLLKKNNEANDWFLNAPAMTLSIIYLAVQIVLCLITAIGASTISFKLTLILNGVLLFMSWILILSTLASRNHIHRIDSRQKDHHIEL